MDYPEPIREALSGYQSTGGNLKTHSASDVFRFHRPDTGDTAFVKVQRPSWGPPLARERDAMDWLSGRLPVPEVAAYHLEGDVEYLVTRALPGLSSEHKECHGDKQRLVEQLAASLHTIHALPIDDCPLNKRPETLISWGRQRIADGIVTQKMVEEEDLKCTPDEALDNLVQRLPRPHPFVFTHGDYCLPNVMIHEDSVSGFIDLGYAGIGDPYRDFIAAQYSVRRNLGQEWVQPFFDAYGIEDLDEEKLRWYRQIQAFD